MSRSNAYQYQLPFEAPVHDLDRQIRSLAARPDAERWGDEIASLRRTRDDLLVKLYADLGAWDTVRVARHPERPQTSDYVDFLARDFRELHGDRQFGDDPAILTGLGRIGGYKVMIVGHRKGRTMQEKMACHFGCAHPEGYRKALAKMRFAEKFGLPIVTFIDTPGAYPGIKAEERGQAEAIAVNLREMSRLRVPVVSIVIGEGGSGGALGIAVADRVAMLEHAWYSVISPEGCASILWKQVDEATNDRAAEALALTARANLKNGIIDAIIPEPLGAAHRDPAAAAEEIRKFVTASLDELVRVKPKALVRRRYERFRALGSFTEEPVGAAD